MRVQGIAILSVLILLVGILPLSLITIGGRTIFLNKNREKFQSVDSEGYDLLIICPDEWIGEIQPLKYHKEDYGVRTIIVGLKEIFNGKHFPAQGKDSQENIKYFIKNGLDTWKITYVLLIGGRKPSFQDEEWYLPVRYSYIEDNVATLEKRHITDLYYADIYDSEGNFQSWDTNQNGIYSEWYANKKAEDIMDLKPEVYLGRLPCRNRLEIQIVLNKIMKYETETWGAPWFKNMVVAGGDTYTFNDYYEGEVTNQKALDNMPEFNHITLWTSDGTLRGPRDVINALNNGCGFLYLAGHGSPTSWGTHPPYDDSTWIYGLQIFQMPALNNKEKLPICVIGGCHNSMFNISFFHSTWTFGLPVPECWSWWLTRALNGGAIATLGCTGLGYGEEDKQGPVKEGGGDHLNTLFFEQYEHGTNDILGEIWGNAITAYIDEFPINWNEKAFNDTALDAKTVQEWILLGDPSLQIGGYPN